MLPSTNEVRIENCTLCNYHCLMCPRESFKRKKEYMNLDLFKLIIKKILKSPLKIDLITLSGFGEFSLDPTWKEKINIIKEHFKNIHIVTNLSNLSINNINFLLDNITTLRVSLYGIDQKTYQKIHNSPKLIKLKDIEEKINYFNDNKEKHQTLILNYIEIEENKHQTQKWIKKWKHKVDLIEVWKPHNWTDGKKYRKIKEKNITCGRPFNSPIQIQVDGTINICCFDYNGVLTIGDLKNNSIKQIYNDNLMKKIQYYHTSNLTDKINLCKKCDQRSIEKKENVIYNSKFSARNRVILTSTNYNEL